MAEHLKQKQFDSIRNVFKAVYDQSLHSQLYVRWNGASQTLQLYRVEKSQRNHKKYIGAIQYEGSNNFEETPPSIVSWRFKRTNLSHSLREKLEAVREFRKDKNTGPDVNPSSESIAFKFKVLGEGEKMAIARIGHILRNTEC